MAATLSHVATLICNPDAPVLGEALVSRARSALNAAGPVRWLAPEVAAEIEFAPEGALDRAALTAELAAALELDELVINTWAHDPAVRRRSYALLAEQFGLAQKRNPSEP